MLPLKSNLDSMRVNDEFILPMNTKRTKQEVLEYVGDEVRQKSLPLKLNLDSGRIYYNSTNIEQTKRNVRAIR